MSPDGKIPRGMLLERKSSIKNASKQFEIAMEMDAQNEKRPKRKQK